MERRRERRFHQSLVCQLDLRGRRCHGLVLNVSPRGLFVQTRARAPEGPDVVVALETMLPNSHAPLPMQAVVVRHFLVPELPALEHGGMGLAIRCAPGAWAELLAGLERKRQVPLSMAPLRPLPRTHCRRCRREVPRSSGVCAWCCEEP